MLTRATRWVYHRRASLKRLVPVRRPVLLRLDGFRLYVRLDDWAVGARIAVRRTYEPHVTATLRALLRPGMTFLDVGANIGYYTMLAATAVGPAGRAIAIEPGADNVALLQRSIAANGFTNVTVHACAAADADGVVGFHHSDSNGQMSAQGIAIGDIAVPAVRLDALLASEPRLDVVKMDIEGAEGRALAGMAALIRRHRPVIVAEFSPAALETVSGVSPEAFLDALRAPGYDVRVIERRGPDARAAPQHNAAILARLDGVASEHLDLLASPESG